MINQQTILKFTSIGRSLDPLSYRTHLALMLMTAVGGVIAGGITLLNSGDLGSAILAGFFTGASIFIAWVIAREVDPDNDYSALVAAFLAFIFASGRLDILSLSAIIILSRIVNRIVGPSAKITDSVLALFLVGVSVLLGNWQMGIVGALAYALDASLSKPLRSQWVFAGLSLALTIGYFVINGVTWVGLTLSTPYLVVLIATSILFGIVALRTTHITVPCDMPTYRVDARRVQAVMGIVWVAGILTAIFFGDNGVNMFLSVWASMAGIAIYRLTVARFVS